MKEMLAVRSEMSRYEVARTFQTNWTFPSPYHPFETRHCRQRGRQLNIPWYMRRWWYAGLVMRERSLA